MVFAFEVEVLIGFVLFLCSLGLIWFGLVTEGVLDFCFCFL